MLYMQHLTFFAKRKTVKEGEVGARIALFYRSPSRPI